GTTEPVRPVLHLQELGTGSHLSGPAPEIPDQRPPISTRIPAALALHALLLLHPRRSPGPHGHVRRVIPAVPDYLLAQRPSLHGRRAPATARALPQKRQRLSRDRRSHRAPSGGRPAQSRDHPQTPGLLDPGAG